MKDQACNYFGTIIIAIIITATSSASAQIDPYNDGHYHVTYGNRTDPRPCAKVEYLRVADSKPLYVCGGIENDLKRVIHGQAQAEEAWVNIKNLNFSGNPARISYNAQDAWGDWWSVQGATKTKITNTTKNMKSQIYWDSSPATKSEGWGELSRPVYRDPYSLGHQSERLVCGTRTRDYTLMGQTPVRINRWLTGAGVCRGEESLGSYRTVTNLWIWGEVIRYVAQEHGKNMTGGAWRLARDGQRGNAYSALHDVMYVGNAVFARGKTWANNKWVWYYIHENRTSGPFVEQRKGPFGANRASELRVVDGKWLFAAAKTNNP